MSDTGKYQVPEGQLSLSGPVEKLVPGTLPVRGDIAHIAMAHRYLVPHYAIPTARQVGDNGATLLLAGRDDADVVTTLAAGSPFEALDYAGEWCWGCVSPEGPSGYLRTADLAPED